MKVYSIIIIRKNDTFIKYSRGKRMPIFMASNKIEF